MKTDYDILIKAAVERNFPAYDWRFYKCQLYQESRLDPGALSGAGASGIAQFMPATWEEWRDKAGYPNASRKDPEASIMTGAMYMDHLHRAWYWPRPEIDRLCLALASYNAGKGNIIKAQRAAGNPSLYAEIIKGLPDITGEKSGETRGYVGKILRYWVDMVSNGE